MGRVRKLLASSLLAFALIGCTAPSPLSKEQADAIDRFEITELMNRYAIAHNTSDIKGYADLFTEDATLYDKTMNYEFARGRDKIMEAAESDRKHFNPSAKGDGTDLPTFKIHHLITNTVVKLNGDGTASGLCYVTMIVNKPDYGPVITSHGYYVDKYVKQKGKWLFSHRDLHAVEWTNWGLAKELGLANGPLPGEDGPKEGQPGYKPKETQAPKN